MREAMVRPAFLTVTPDPVSPAPAWQQERMISARQATCEEVAELYVQDSL